MRPLGILSPQFPRLCTLFYLSYERVVYQQRWKCVTAVSFAQHLQVSIPSPPQSWLCPAELWGADSVPPPSHRHRGPLGAQGRSERWDSPCPGLREAEGNAGLGELSFFFCQWLLALIDFSFILVFCFFSISALPNVLS